MSNQPQQCSSDVMAHTGICVDPTNEAPPSINCLRHQAPRGFRYVNQNGVCLLMQTSSGRIITTQAGYAPPILGTSAPTVAAGNIVADAGNWVMNNKGLALVLALGAAWYISKNK